MTAVLSVRVKKNLKKEAEKLGLDLREKKSNAQKIAKELRELMNVKPQEWVNDVRETRNEM